MNRLKQLVARMSPREEKFISFEVRAANALRDHREAARIAGTLHEVEIAAASRAEDALRSGSLVMLGWPTQAESAFESFWKENISFHQFFERQIEARRKAHVAGIKFSLMSPRWSLMLSDDFIRSIAKIDKKLQGRVLEALTRITESPTTAVGDTVKPLGGDLKGLWRFRIGDYRLVYDPNLSDHHITLLSFEPRGDAY